MNSTTLTRWQAVSSLVFLPFLVVHLSTQVSAVFGAQAYDAVQASVRAVYQSPLVEGPLLLALGSHAVLAIIALVRRRELSRRARVHSVTGLFLLVFIVGHVVATRGASLVAGVFPGFAGVAFTLRWVPAWFWPYYLLLGLSGAVHAALGLSLVLARSSGRLALPGVRARLGVGLAVVLGVSSTLAVLALGGVFFEVGAVEQGPYARLLRRLGLVADVRSADGSSAAAAASRSAVAGPARSP